MTNSKVHLITGGQRSGKSEYAEKLTLRLSKTPCYLATSKSWDDEFQKRIETHQSRRSSNWITIEEEIYISKIKPSSNVILLDCITLWLTNIMDTNNYDPDKSLQFALEEWDRFTKLEATILVVSNEIGMGLIPMEKGSRNFVDLQGKMNQYIAKNAEEVSFMVSGISLKIK